MATTIAELLVEIGVSVDGAEKAEKQIAEIGDTAKESGRDVESKFGGAVDAAGVKTVALGNILAGGAQALARLAVQALQTAAAFAVDLVTGFARAGDEIAKTSRQIGVGAEDLQRLRFAAERSGVEVGQLQAGLKRLQVGLVEAREKGTGPTSEGLDLLGVSLQDLPTDDTEAALGILADAFSTLENETERTAIASRIFGEEAGPALKTLLDEGSEGIEDLGDRAEELGGVLGEDALGAAESLTDSFTDLQTLFDGVKNQIGAELAPVVTDLVGRITDFVAENDDLIKQDLPKLFEALADVIPPILKFTAELIDGIAFLVTEFQRLNREAEAGIGFGGTLADVFEGLALPVRTLVDLINRAVSALGNLADRVDVLGNARDKINSAFGFQRQEGRFATDAASGERVSATQVAASAGNAAAQAQLDRQNEELLQRALESEAAEEAAIFRAQQEANRAGVQRERARADRDARAGRTGRGRGRGRSRAEAAVTSDVTFEDVLRGVIGGRGDEIANNIRGLAGRTPSADAIKPTVAVTFFNFDVTQNITGEADPAEIGRQASEAIRREFRTQTARAGTTLSSNIVR